MTQLALGTVQFGLNYGITNTEGDISDTTMATMLELAARRGIELFDTAADYGTSQQRLGSMPSPVSPRKYVTKFSLAPDGSEPTPSNIFEASMRQLGVDQLHGVLFHKLENLADSRCSATVEILREGKKAGKILRIGVSIYNVEDLSQALDVFPDLDIIQLPANVLDFGLLESPEVQAVRSRGTEIHVRSIFLQGLLLSNPANLPIFFEPLKPALDALNLIAQQSERSVLELILGKMRNHPSIDAVIVGATTVSELDEVTSAWISAEEVVDFALPEVPRQMLDPRGWPQIRMNT